MRKTNEEFKAEVFRRRDEYYKKRNRRIRIAAISSAPLACLTAFMILILPAMMPASKADPNFHYSKTEEVSGEEIRVNVKEILYAKCSNKTYSDMKINTLPEERMEEFLDFFVYLTAPEEITEEKTTVGDSATEIISGITTTATTTSGYGKPYYRITLKYEFGNPRTYTVYKDSSTDVFYVADGAARFELTYSQFKYIESIFG